MKKGMTIIRTIQASFWLINGYILWHKEWSTFLFHSGIWIFIFVLATHGEIRPKEAFKFLFLWWPWPWSKEFKSDRKSEAAEAPSVTDGWTPCSEPKQESCYCIVMNANTGWRGILRWDSAAHQWMDETTPHRGEITHWRPI